MERRKKLKESDQKTVKKAPPSPYLKTTYLEDMIFEAFATPFRKKWLSVGILGFLVFPFIATPFLLHIANLVAISCIGAMALNLVIGTAGLLSLGHAGFMLAGAFTSSLLYTQFEIPMMIALIGAGVVGGILGLIASLPSARLKGFYLGISTLALHYIVVYLVSEYQFNVGAGYGIDINNPFTGTGIFSGKQIWYFFLGMAVWVTGLFIGNLLRSKPGRAWIALRDREIAAQVMGIQVGLYKSLAFMVSSVITAIAGALYAFYTNQVAVEEYSFVMTISYLAMIIVGGLGSILGSLLGAIIITLTPHLLMYLFGAMGIPNSWMAYFNALESGIFGIMIIVFILVEPLGVSIIWARMKTFFMLWPFKYKPLKITKR